MSTIRRSSRRRTSPSSPPSFRNGCGPPVRRPRGRRVRGRSGERSRGRWHPACSSVAPTKGTTTVPKLTVGSALETRATHLSSDSSFPCAFHRESTIPMNTLSEPKTLKSFISADSLDHSGRSKSSWGTGVSGGDADMKAVAVVGERVVVSTNSGVGTWCVGWTCGGMSGRGASSGMRFGADGEGRTARCRRLSFSK
jgi:hypothetical protein